ncbi:MAG: nitrophenyl compound nitroreductase subunit ArsF family protein [Saprospiraceae bacterium]
MTKLFLTPTLVTLLFLVFSSSSCGQTPKKGISEANTSPNVQVLQFHSTHRCVTCNHIEKLTKETLQKYPAIPFILVNVDDKKNEKIAEKFEATGTALFLFNPKTGSKKDLTDFAFMKAKNKPEEFKKGLEKEINLFK